MIYFEYIPAIAGSRNCLNATFLVPRGVLIFVPFGLYDRWSSVVDFYLNKSFVMKIKFTFLNTTCVVRRSPGTPKFDEGICCIVGDDDSKYTISSLI